MDKSMTLSEAIRLGAMLLPQGFLSDGMHASNHSCALAAACDAVGISRVSVEMHPYHNLTERFPLLNKKLMLSVGRNVKEEIWHRNDTLKHSREAIADWVETLEKEQPCDTSLTNVPSVSSSTVETS